MASDQRCDSSAAVTQAILPTSRFRSAKSACIWQRCKGPALQALLFSVMLFFINIERKRSQWSRHIIAESHPLAASSKFQAGVHYVNRITSQLAINAAVAVFSIHQEVISPAECWCGRPPVNEVGVFHTRRTPALSSLSSAKRQPLAWKASTKPD